MQQRWASIRTLSLLFGTEIFFYFTFSQQPFPYLIRYIPRFPTEGIVWSLDWSELTTGSKSINFCLVPAAKSRSSAMFFYEIYFHVEILIELFCCVWNEILIHKKWGRLRMVCFDCFSTKIESCTEKNRWKIEGKRKWFTRTFS